jgi:hypothetical protein
MKDEIDTRIMRCVVEALERNPGPADRQALNRVLEKQASKEAQAIAEQYLRARRGR